jgi:hypothetical protein
MAFGKGLTTPGAGGPFRMIIVLVANAGIETATCMAELDSAQKRAFGVKGAVGIDFGLAPNRSQFPITMDGRRRTVWDEHF